MSGNSSRNGGREGPANRYQKPPAPKKKNPVVEFIKGGGITGAIIRGISEGIKKSKTNRQLLGTSDYQGGSKSRVNISPPDRDGGSNNNQVPQTTQVTQMTQVPKTILSPTTAEVSQSEAANAVNEEDPLYLRKKKTKAKGRSQTILTSSRGVTTDEGLILGKKSLLGA